MKKTELGCLHTGDVFELNNKTYKVGHYISNSNGYVACTDLQMGKVKRIYIGTDVEVEDKNT
jgi:hypothetical protein